MKFSFFLLFIVIPAALAESGATADEFFSGERNALIDLRDSLTAAVDLHSNWTGPPCYINRSRWIGVTCSDSHVVGLALDGIHLTGTLRPTALQNVTFLTNLSLANNALRGELPTLQGLLHLKSVSFAGNRFSGPIPVGFIGLPDLQRLELQDNLLNGTIPPFNQWSLRVCNVSYNFLEGEIPDTAVLWRLPSSSFDHNLELCGGPLNKPCQMAPSPTPGVPAASPVSPSPVVNKALPTWSLVLIAVAAVAIPFVLILCFWFYFKRIYRKEGDGGYTPVGVLSDLEDKKHKGMGSEADTKVLEFFNRERTEFNLNDLLRSSAEVLGKGKLGTTYRAVLESGQVVVVKRFKDMNAVSRKDFVQQMQLLGRLRHVNLVEVISYYYSKDEKLIIYDHVPDGNLCHLLCGNRGEGRVPLKWASRLRIVRSIARGLAYLHQCLPSNKLLHANLKASNILILHNRYRRGYHSKLTDFGFHSLLPGPAYVKKLAVGKSPEFAQGRKLTHKADTYCFGLVLLEVITGQMQSDDDDTFPEWVRSVVCNEWSTDVLDIELVAEKECYEEMLKLTNIALECTEIDPKRRPDMSEVVKRIEEIRVRVANAGERTSLGR